MNPTIKKEETDGITTSARRVTAVAARQRQQKEQLLENLAKVPIIHSACDRVGIARASFYRWRADDEGFARKVEEALAEGTAFMNDAAEAQLLKAIREGNLSAVFFWMKHKNPAFSNRLEVTAKVKTESDALTPEQEALIKRALELSGIAQEGGTKYEGTGE